MANTFESGEKESLENKWIFTGTALAIGMSNVKDITFDESEAGAPMLIFPGDDERYKDISERHALIIREKGNKKNSYYIGDNNSKLGTFVDKGEKLIELRSKTSELSDGDIIGLGPKEEPKIKLRVKISNKGLTLTLIEP